ncbi:MAG: energy transducer TonB [candidate division WOR-3 bacterium]|nr:energy transducer TonB [candidate division WOR-3 bacterium]MCX7837100.1 energy transducer TonB [candidate division WOR-3 bacterium]MDW8114476.1 energy transducer TonB [candidate division WOR-3 bacterium]
MNKIKTIDIAILLSVLFHFSLLFLFNQIKEKEFTYEDLREITFIDQSYRPEVAKVIKPTKKGEENVKNIKENNIEKREAEELATVDLTKKIAISQGKINLNYFQIEKEEGFDVIKINTDKKPTKTIEEILKEEPIKLTMREKSSEIGFGVYKEREEPISLETKILKKEKKIEWQEKSNQELKIPISQEKQTEINIAGPISERKILKKSLPKYPSWAIEKRISGFVILKIWVTPEGKVEENIEIIESSGYPQLDKIVLETIKEWVFAPLEKETKKEIQWGIIKFRFELS